MYHQSNLFLNCFLGADVITVKALLSLADLVDMLTNRKENYCPLKPNLSLSFDFYVHLVVFSFIFDEGTK